MRDSDWSRQILLRSDWLLPIGAIMTTEVDTLILKTGLIITHLAHRTTSMYVLSGRKKETFNNIDQSLINDKFKVYMYAPEGLEVASK